MPLARTHDPETSHAAAAAVPTFQAKHEAKIYNAICEAEPLGMTYREIAAVTGLEPVAVARRLCSMERRNLISRRYWPEAPEVLWKREGMAVWFRAWQTTIQAPA